MPKHFVYIQYGCRMQSEASCSLNQDITTSLRLRPQIYPPKPKICPPPAQAYQCKGKLIWPFTPSQASNLKHCVYIQYMDVGCGLKPAVASTMTLQHHSSDLDIPPKKQNQPPTLHMPNSVRGGPI